jgi:hypothetical protein
MKQIRPILPTLTRHFTTLFLLAFLICAVTPSFAKKKAGSSSGGDTGSSGGEKILEISFASVTVDTGGGTQATYKIVDSSKITLNGNAATVDDVLAGMLANVTLSPDNTTVVTLDATDPKGPPKKGKL